MHSVVTPRAAACPTLQIPLTKVFEHVVHTNPSEMENDWR